MNRYLLAMLLPPLAVCRYGCAGCCAVPIGVMWITGIISIAYGLSGGPAALEQISWVTVGLGFGLLALSSMWAATVIRGVIEDEANPKCEPGSKSTLCRMVTDDDDHDPMSDIEKLSH